ncbi:MAG: marine proteobacterial sortase target protein, partial [Gammaproteobacteria bacterium]|nr:marine proteobacterial sortase target protein [Gammaproteobacteria bacterium]
ENRLFTVGIGSAPNSFFMKKAAQAGRGSYTFIKDVQEVAAKTNILLRKLETPALTDIQIAIDGKELEYFSDPIPDLYIGEPLTVVLRGIDLAKEVTLTGKIGSNSWRQTLQLDQGYENEGVKTVWVREKIAALSKSYHDAESRTLKESLKSEITALSIKHHLVSQYTSLVAVDVTPVNRSGQLYQERIKNNLPHGWRGNRAVAKSGSNITLPQTATSSYRDLILALLFISFALFLRSVRRRV